MRTVVVLWCLGMAGCAGGPPTGYDVEEPAPIEEGEDAVEVPEPAPTIEPYDDVVEGAIVGPNTVRVVARRLDAVGGSSRARTDRLFAVGDRVQLEVLSDLPGRLVVFEEVLPEYARRLAQVRLEPGAARVLAPTLTLDDRAEPMRLLVAVEPLSRAAPPDSPEAWSRRYQKLVERVYPLERDEGSWQRFGGDRPVVAAYVELRTRPGPPKARSLDNPCAECRAILHTASGEARFALQLAPDQEGVVFVKTMIELRTREGRACELHSLGEGWLPDTLVEIEPKKVSDRCVHTEGWPNTVQAILRLTRRSPQKRRARMEARMRVLVSDW